MSGDQMFLLDTAGNEDKPEELSHNGVFEVSEVTERIKLLIDKDKTLAGIHIRGEISNYKTYNSGHHYFTLKDASSQIKCVMFKGSAQKLRFKPLDGMKVIAFGRVEVYMRDGAYQFYVSELVPDGIGDLYAEYERLKEKLRLEGLFDAEHKKPIPRIPQKIAVVTSGDGAAVRDIIRILRTRWSLAKVIVLPVRVQGEEAPREIVGAIRYCNKYNIADVIITGRGGGSIEDLWAFNDERVCRAIYDSQIPVISAVGHEPDVTISDFVADRRASTPSNAAEIAVPDVSEVTDVLYTYAEKLKQSLIVSIEAKRRRLETRAESRMFENPETYFTDRQIMLDRNYERIGAIIDKLLTKKSHELAEKAAAIDGMSPLKVVARGYSIASDKDGNIITDSGAVKAGDPVSVRLNKGEIDCIVENVR